MSYDSRERYHQMMRRKEREAAIWQQYHPEPETIDLRTSIEQIFYPNYRKDKETEE